MEQHQENRVELRKIPLEGFIAILQQLYDDGADYVDIIGKPNELQDVMQIVVREEYIEGYVKEDTPVKEEVPPASITNFTDLV